MQADSGKIFKALNGDVKTVNIHLICKLYKLFVSPPCMVRCETDKGTSIKTTDPGKIPFLINLSPWCHAQGSFLLSKFSSPRLRCAEATTSSCYRKSIQVMHSLQRRHSLETEWVEEVLGEEAILLQEEMVRLAECLGHNGV